jgi:hypothetical protein
MGCPRHKLESAQVVCFIRFLSIKALQIFESLATPPASMTASLCCTESAAMFPIAQTAC